MTRLSRMAAGMWSAAARAEVHAEHGNDAAAERDRAWVRLWSAAVLREQAPAFVRCRCCHRAYDLAAWRSLRLVGDMITEGEPGFPAVLRFRDCVCRNTLTVDRDLEAA